MPDSREAAQGHAGAVAPHGFVLQVQRLVEREGADIVVEEEPPVGLDVDGQLVGAPLAPLAQGEAGVEHERQALHAVDGLPELRLGVRAPFAQQGLGADDVDRGLLGSLDGDPFDQEARRLLQGLGRVHGQQEEGDAPERACPHVRKPPTTGTGRHGAWLQPHRKGKADAVSLPPLRKRSEAMDT
jgi:hypothetical protein